MAQKKQSMIFKLINMFDNKKKRNYVSDLGIFMKEFDETYPKKSKSQQDEIDKHKDIFDRKKSNLF